MRAVRTRRRIRGQALAEFAIAAPLLLVLLVGSAQVGIIAYGNVTIDTAAREGARLASERPVNATTFSGTSHTFVGCAASDISANYAVQAVCNNAGILDTSKITVTISKNVDPTAYAPPTDVHLTAVHMGTDGCAGGQRLVTGTVSNVPSGGTVNITTNADNTINIVDAPSSPGYPAYSGCFPNATQTLYAIVSSGCNAWSASASGVNPPATVNFTLAQTVSCPPPISTSTALTVSGNGGPYGSSTTVTVGQLVTFNAVVTPASGSAPGGSVTFVDANCGGSTTLGNVTLTSGSAQFTTSSLSASCQHTVTATYSPDGAHSGSTSNTVSVNVNTSATGKATTIALSASPTQTQQGQTVTLTATISTNPTDAMTGTVTFTDTTGTGTIQLSNPPVVVAGNQAQLSISTLPVGTNLIVATYSGDVTHAASTSTDQTVVITAVTGSGGGPPGPGPFACTDPPSGLTSMYVQVDVSYPVPVFVPLVGSLFQNGNGVRTITVTQFIRVEPCGMTKGG